MLVPVLTRFEHLIMRSESTPPTQPPYYAISAEDNALQGMLNEIIDFIRFRHPMSADRQTQPEMAWDYSGISSLHTRLMHALAGFDINHPPKILLYNTARVFDAGLRLPLGQETQWQLFVKATYMLREYRRPRNPSDIHLALYYSMRHVIDWAKETLDSADADSTLSDVEQMRSVLLDVLDTLLLFVPGDIAVKYEDEIRTAIHDIRNAPTNGLYPTIQNAREICHKILENVEDE
jgi:hypothetical protein